MKIEDLSQEVKDKVKQLLEDAPADQKADAIMQSIEMIQETTHAMMLNIKSSLDSGIFHSKKRNSTKASRISDSRSQQIRSISFRQRLSTEH